MRYPTPAQAYGHPRLSDVPVAGPTDPGILQADCWWTQNVVQQKTGCVDCHGGVVPAWTKTNGIGLDGAISRGGRVAVGFGAAGDPEVYSALSADQKNWVLNTLNNLNTRIMTANAGNVCASWAADIQHMTGCFQLWFNSIASIAKGGLLRTDGVFDDETLTALKAVTNDHSGDFAPFPASSSLPTAVAPAPVTPAPAATVAPSVAPIAQQQAAAPSPKSAPAAAPAAIRIPAAVEGMSTGAKIGIGAAGVAVLGLIYAVAR